MIEFDYDVAVVGAGLAGLAAADMLKENGKKFVVLEGADRVGGRVRTLAGVDGYLDLGGQYIGPTQGYIEAFVDRFAARITKSDVYLPDDKHSVLEDDNGMLSLFSDSYPATRDVLDSLAKIERLVQLVRVDMDSPWNTHLARQFDGMSVADWFVAAQLPPLPIALLTLGVRAAFSVEPEELSFLYVLHYCASAGSFRTLMDVKGGVDSMRLTRGAGELPSCLADAVGHDNIHLSRKVTKIREIEGGVEITAVESVGAGADSSCDEPTTREHVYRARYAVVAMAPTQVAKFIQFEPPLEKSEMGRMRLNLVKGSTMGRTIKGFVRYEKPWWRARYPGHPGYTGYTISLKGPVCWTMDYCWWDASDDQWRHPALMFFIVGKDFDVWAKVSVEERRAAVLKQLGDIFSSSEASNAIGYHETNWTENEWSSGCPTACLKVNTLTSFGQALRAPIGRVHWAGAEVATVSVGYMDGALQSGLRAATEILALLDSAS